jgi:Tfp pilus assembly protein PilN
MKQQVNLYLALPKQAPIVISFGFMIKIWLAVIVLAAGIFGVEKWVLHKETAHYAQMQKDQKVATERLASMSDDVPGANNLSTLTKQNTELQQELAVKQQLANILKANLLNTKGFSPYLLEISRNIPATVWLQNIELRDGGKLMRLSGKSYQADAITDFSNNLHNTEQFSMWRFQLAQVATDPQESGTLVFVVEAKNETVTASSTVPAATP